MGLQLKIGADFGDVQAQAKALEKTIDSLGGKLLGLNQTIRVSINPQLDAEAIRRQISSIKDTVIEISGNIDINDQKANAVLKSLQSKLNLLDDLSLDITANKTQVEGVIKDIVGDLTELKGLSVINVTANLDATQIQQQISKIRQSVIEVSGKVDLNDADVNAAIKSIQSKLGSLDDLSLDITANKTQIESVISEITGDITGLKRLANIEVTAQTNFDALVADIKSDLANLTATAKVGINAADFDASLQKITDKIASLKDGSIDIKANPAQAEVAINELVSHINTLRGTTVILKADGTQAVKIIDNIEGQLQSLKANISIEGIQEKAAEIKQAFGQLNFFANVDVNEGEVNSVIKSINEKLSLLSDPTIDFKANPVQAENAINEIVSLLTSLKDANVSLSVSGAEALESFISQIQGDLLEVRKLANITVAVTGDVRIDDLKNKLATIAAIDITANKEQAKAAIEQLLAQLNGLRDENIILRADGSPALAVIDKIEAELKTLVGEIDFDTSGFSEAIQRIRGQVDGLDIPVRIDIKSEIDKVKAELQTISSSAKVGIDTTEFDAALKEVQAKIAALDAPDIDLTANPEQVEATLKDITRDLSRLKGSVITLDANGKPAIKSINELEKELADLEKDLKAATNPKDFQNLARAAGLVREQIRGINTTGLSSSFQRVSRSGGEATQTLINLSRVAQDAPFGFLGIANNINPLVESFQRLQVASKATGTSLTRNIVNALSGPAGIGLALGVGSSLLISYGDDLKKLISGSSDFSEAIDKASDSVLQNASKVTILVKALQSDTLTTEQSKRAKKELIDIAPEFQSSFDGNKLSIERSEAALKTYIDNLVKTVKVTAALGIVNDKLKESISQIAKGGETTFFQKLGSIIKSGGNVVDAGVDNINNAFDNLDKAKDNLKSENISKLIQETFKSLGITFEDATNTITKGGEKITKSLDQIQNDVIGKAKQFVKEFGNVFAVPDLDESFFISKDEIFNRAKKLLADIKLDNLKIKLPGLIEHKTVVDEIIRDIDGVIKEVKTRKIVVPIVTETDFIQIQEGLPKEQIDKLQESFFEELKKAQQEPFIYDPSIQIAVNKEKAAADAAKQAEQLAESIRNIFASAFQSLGEDIGNALTGGENLFQSVFQIIGSGVQALGKQIVALGVAALNLKKALATLLANPGLAIAAGIALTAIGTAMKNIAGGGVQGFAEGGFVSGRGGSKSDRIPAMLSNGEFVVNAAATRKHLGLLSLINSGLKLPKFADGGLVTGLTINNSLPSVESFRGILANLSLPQEQTRQGGRLRAKGRDLILVENRERRSQRI